MADLSRNLEVVSSDTERPGYRTYGVVDDGAFVPIAQHKLGHLENFAASPVSVAVKKADKKTAKPTADKPDDEA